jgi:eukaryotic-like serine/threonine-protein kinase
MNSSDSWRLAQLFDELADLDGEARRQRLGALAFELPAELLEELRRLLALDAATTRRNEDPLAAAVADAVGQGSLVPGAGLRLGPWRVLRELGSGGMGTVLLAERAEGDFEQRVAIKLIRGFPGAEERRRLRHERRVLAQLDHPNIARLLDGGETADGQPYVVMEYVDGLGLLEYLAANPLDLRQRLALFDRIADAVQHAHERLVIHRDLKPNNVMVRADGDPRLLDFGVAKLVDVSQGEDGRSTSTRVWTPGYASPEQRAGGQITTATDVFGLSILLREMLTGDRLPGQASPLPRGFVGLKLDAELRGILEAGSAEDARRRYPTVEALRADLQRWLEGRTVRVAPDTAAYRLRKFVRRHRVGVAVAAGLLIAATLFVWRLEIERDRARAAEADALAARAAAEDEAANARAALGFLSGTLVAMAPENALAREVSVRELLRTARAGLDAQLGAQPRVRRQVQRLLAHLYVALSEPREAVLLFEAGLAGEVPRQRAEALALAADLDEYAGVLGVLERGQEGLAAAERAAALRREFAPEDEIEALRSTDQLAYAHYRLGDFGRAETLWRQLIERAPELPQVPPEILDNSLQALAGMLTHENRAAEALELLDRAEAQMAGRVPEGSPARVAAMRGRIDALVQLGRPREAEALARQALQIQERTVGERSARTAYLLNSLGVALNEQGRFREAAEVLQTSLELGRELQGVDGDEAISLLNIAAVQESAGDYAAALAMFDRAIELLEPSEPSSDSLRLRQARRSRARTLGLMGRTDAALETLSALEKQSIELDGEDAFEPAMLAWQRAVVARAGERPKEGLAALAVAAERMRALLPEQHSLFAYAHRLRGYFLSLQGELGAAAREIDAGFALLQANEGVPLDVAVMQAERARLHLLMGERGKARSLLRKALPVLREAVLPEEINRAAAERLAAELGI